MGKFLVKYSDSSGDFAVLPLPAALTVIAIVLGAGAYGIISAIGLGAFLKGLVVIGFLAVVVFGIIFTIWAIASVGVFLETRSAAKLARKNKDYYNDNQHNFMEKEYCNYDRDDKEDRCHKIGEFK